MSLRKKIFLILVLALTATFVILSVLSRILLGHSYKTLETRQVTDNVKLLKSGLKKQEEQIRTLTAAWARWQGTELFAKKPSGMFPIEKLAKAFYNFRLNFIGLFGQDGHPLYLRINDPGSSQGFTYPPKKLTDFFAELSDLIREDRAETSRYGIILSSICPIIIALQPIQEGHLDYKTARTLVFGRCVGIDDLKELASTFHMTISLSNLKHAPPWDLNLAKEAQTVPGYTLVRPVDHDTVEGVTIIRDISGRPALLLKVMQPRTIYKNGLDTTYTFQLIVMVIGLCLGIIIIWLIESQILIHIQRLTTAVTRIKKDHDLDVRVPEEGPSELRSLSAAFNTMIDSLSHYQNELLSVQRHLEKKVKQRTRELEIAYIQLLHAEKLGCLGRMSASVAHEFGNPLFGIRNVLVHLKDQECLDKTSREALEMGLKECDRLKALMGRLKDFYSPSPDTITEVDLHKLLDEVLLLYRKALNQQNIAVRRQYAPGLPQIPAVPDQIKQVILNLIKNAKEAMPGSGGIITIETRRGKKNVYMTVKDTGQGIRPEYMDRIFEPFFSTKEGEGTGLGLSVSYMIIKKHGGSIEVDSKPGKGTTFTIKLPLNRTGSNPD